MLHMTGDGRDKQQSGLCCAATSLLLVIHATSLDTLCSDLATHVAERKKRVCDTTELQQKQIKYTVKLNNSYRKQYRWDYNISPTAHHTPTSGIGSSNRQCSAYHPYQF